MYFPIFILHDWGKKSAAQPKTIYSEVPLVGECKYKNEPFSYGEYMKTRIKLTPLKENATFYYALFSKSGFDEKVVSEARGNSNLLLFDLPRIVNLKEI